MIFKLHFWLLEAGANAISYLLGVYIQTYTDASSIEISSLFMLMPFMGLLFRPIICLYADRYQAHQKFMLCLLFLLGISYCPFVIIPLLGENIYGKNARICWYVLLFFKVFGDIAFEGIVSIGDSLAINYAKRIGTEYSLYKVWGTISWIVFGLIIGQINEIWFLPKYTPAFIILVLSSFLDMSLFWLWPKEYFLMVSDNEIIKSKNSFKVETKSLMPKKVVLKYMKSRLFLLMSYFFPCFNYYSKENNGKKLNHSTQPSVIMNNNFDQEIKAPSSSVETNERIDKLSQLKIIHLLFKNDIRLISYILLYILFGLFMCTVNYFSINLSIVCREKGTCNYSNLAGLLQASMASVETIFFIYMNKIQLFFGRLNLAGIALLLATIKLTFYATIWNFVNPHYSLLVEAVVGVVYSIFITMQVETARMFANEIDFILPELIDKKLIKNVDETEKIKLSLLATMQAILGSATDGIGRGFGALFYGIIIENYSYNSLWIILSILFAICTMITFSISIIDFIFELKVGPKKKKKNRKYLTEQKVLSIYSVDKNQNFSDASCC